MYKTAVFHKTISPRKLIPLRYIIFGTNIRSNSVLSNDLLAWYLIGLLKVGPKIALRCYYGRCNVKNKDAIRSGKVNAGPTKKKFLVTFVMLKRILFFILFFFLLSIYFNRINFQKYVQIYKLYTKFLFSKVSCIKVWSNRYQAEVRRHKPF